MATVSTPLQEAVRSAWEALPGGFDGDEEKTAAVRNVLEGAEDGELSVEAFVAVMQGLPYKQRVGFLPRFVSKCKELQVPGMAHKLVGLVEGLMRFKAGGQETTSVKMQEVDEDFVELLTPQEEFSNRYDLLQMALFALPALGADGQHLLGSELATSSTKMQNLVAKILVQSAEISDEQLLGLMRGSTSGMRRTIASCLERRGRHRAGVFKALVADASAGQDQARLARRVLLCAPREVVEPWLRAQLEPRMSKSTQLDREVSYSLGSGIPHENLWKRFPDLMLGLFREHLESVRGFPLCAAIVHQEWTPIICQPSKEQQAACVGILDLVLEFPPWRVTCTGTTSHELVKAAHNKQEIDASMCAESPLFEMDSTVLQRFGPLVAGVPLDWLVDKLQGRLLAAKPHPLCGPSYSRHWEPWRTAIVDELCSRIKDERSARAGQFSSGGKRSSGLEGAIRDKLKLLAWVTGLVTDMLSKPALAFKFSSRKALTVDLHPSAVTMELALGDADKCAVQVRELDELKTTFQENAQPLLSHCWKLLEVSLRASLLGCGRKKFRDPLLLAPALSSVEALANALASKKALPGAKEVGQADFCDAFAQELIQRFVVAFLVRAATMKQPSADISARCDNLILAHFEEVSLTTSVKSIPELVSLVCSQLVPFHGLLLVPGASVQLCSKLLHMHVDALCDLVNLILRPEILDQVEPGQVCTLLSTAQSLVMDYAASRPEVVPLALRIVDAVFARWDPLTTSDLLDPQSVTDKNRENLEEQFVWDPVMQVVVRKKLPEDWCSSIQLTALGVIQSFILSDASAKRLKDIEQLVKGFSEVMYDENESVSRAFHGDHLTLSAKALAVTQDTRLEGDALWKRFCAWALRSEDLVEAWERRVNLCARGLSGERNQLAKAVSAPTSAMPKRSSKNWQSLWASICSFRSFLPLDKLDPSVEEFMFASLTYDELTARSFLEAMSSRGHKVLGDNAHGKVVPGKLLTMCFGSGPVDWFDCLIHRLSVWYQENKVLQANVKDQMAAALEPMASALDKSFAEQRKDKLTVGTFQPGRLERMQEMLTQALRSRSKHQIVFSLKQIFHGLRNEQGANRLEGLRMVGWLWSQVVVTMVLLPEVKGPIPESFDRRAIANVHKEFAETWTQLVKQSTGAVNMDKASYNSMVRGLQDQVGQVQYACFWSPRDADVMAGLHQSLELRQFYYDTACQCQLLLESLVGGSKICEDIVLCHPKWSTDFAELREFCGADFDKLRGGLTRLFELGGFHGAARDEMFARLKRVLRDSFVDDTWARGQSAWGFHVRPKELVALVNGAYAALGIVDPFRAKFEKGEASSSGEYLGRKSASLRRIKCMAASLRGRWLETPSVLETVDQVTMCLDEGTPPHHIDQSYDLMSLLSFLSFQLKNAMPCLRRATQRLVDALTFVRHQTKHSVQSNRRMIQLLATMRQERPSLTVLAKEIEAVMSSASTDGVSEAMHALVLLTTSREMIPKERKDKVQSVCATAREMLDVDQSAIHLRSVSKGLAKFRQDMLAQFTDPALALHDRHEGLFSQNREQLEELEGFTDKEREKELRKQVVEMLRELYDQAAAEVAESKVVSPGTQASISTTIQNVFKGDDPLTCLAFLLSPRVIKQDISNATALAIRRVRDLLSDDLLVNTLALVLSESRREVLRPGLHKSIVNLLARIGNKGAYDLLLAEWGREKASKDVRVKIVEEALELLTHGDDDSVAAEFAFAVLGSLARAPEATPLFAQIFRARPGTMRHQLSALSSEFPFSGGRGSSDVRQARHVELVAACSDRTFRLAPRHTDRYFIEVVTPALNGVQPFSTTLDEQLVCTVSAAYVLAFWLLHLDSVDVFVAIAKACEPQPVESVEAAKLVSLWKPDSLGGARVVTAITARLWFAFFKAFDPAKDLVASSEDLKPLTEMFSADADVVLFSSPLNANVRALADFRLSHFLNVLGQLRKVDKLAARADKFAAAILSSDTVVDRLEAVESLKLLPVVSKQIRGWL
ncbi:Uncharacterized protein SCF082_LOCUS44953, partial [Durusdinium trenchii]